MNKQLDKRIIKVLSSTWTILNISGQLNYITMRYKDKCTCNCSGGYCVVRNGEIHVWCSECDYTNLSDALMGLLRNE